MSDTTTQRSADSTGEALMSYDDRAVVWQLVGRRCPVCDCLMVAPWMAFDRVSGLTIDHLVAYSEGGSNELGNLIPLCASCNSSKCAKTLIEWLPGRMVATGATKAKTASGQLRAAALMAQRLETLAAEIKAALTA